MRRGDIVRVMDCGDIVQVMDCSYCMLYGPAGGLRHIANDAFRHRRWEVLAMNLIGPTYDGIAPPASPNDIMLCEVNYLGNILFTQSCYCVPADSTRTPPGPARVTVPADTNQLIVTFE